MEKLGFLKCLFSLYSQPLLTASVKMRKAVKTMLVGFFWYRKLFNWTEQYNNSYSNEVKWIFLVKKVCFHFNFSLSIKFWIHSQYRLILQFLQKSPYITALFFLRQLKAFALLECIYLGLVSSFSSIHRSLLFFCRQFKNWGICD